jgi:outer membrane protein TolC
MRLSILIAGVLLCGGTAAAQTPAARPDITPSVITMDEAIRRALEIQPTMVQALGAERNASAGERTAKGAFLPSLSFNASSNTNSANRFNSQIGQIVHLPSNTAYSTTLSASFNIFEGFARTAGLNSARATADAAAAGYTTARYQTILGVKQAYFAVLADEELVHVAQVQAQAAQTQLQVATDKLRAGAGVRSDSLSAAVAYGNAQVALLTAQANLAGAQVTLGRQVGINGSVRAVADSTIPAFPDTAAIQAMEIGSTPLVASADALLHAANSQVTVSRAQYWPVFRVSYSNGFNGSRFPLTTDSTRVNSWSYGFSLNWTLFNGFVREQGVTSASVARDIAMSQAADIRRSVNASISQQVIALAAAHTQVAISEQNVASGTEGLRVAQEKFKFGAGLLVDVETAESNLAQAQVNLVQARFSYRTALATLAALLGKDM